MIGYIIGIIIGSIILLFLFSILVYFLWKKRSEIKLIKRLGKTAEDNVNNDIGIWTKHTRNKFIPSTIFSYNDNKVFEVDSIVITNKGIFVVEIKSIKGIVEGNAKSEFWIKKLGENKFNISNPIMQNEKHIQHLVKMTGIRVPIISLIVFSDKTSYIKVEDKPSHVIVLKHNELFNSLDKIMSILPTRISETEKGEIFKTFLSYKANKAAMKLHENIVKGKKWK